MNANLAASPKVERVAPNASGKSEDPAPPRAMRSIAPAFTIDGSAELEQHLARTCEKIAAGVRGLVGRQRLEGLLLAGGYGRGEGGVLRTASGNRPYNDLEFYVFLRGNRHLNERRFGRALHVLGEILTPQAGVEVEFKIASLRELATSPVSMFSYDLVMGHHWITGGDELLAGCGHHCEAGQIPLREATRLLMNRCSGLLFARERLAQPRLTPADADFVRRNIAKAELALGDAVLVAYRLYHWSVRERHRRLAQVTRTESTPWLDGVLRHHAIGAQFKLHPERSVAPRDELAALHAEVAGLAQDVWLWVETQRLGTPFSSPRDYAFHPGPKWPDAAPLRNALINARSLGPRALLGARATRHPRERILNALGLLMWAPAALETAEGQRFLQRELQTTATTFPEIMHAYRALWSHVN